MGHFNSPEILRELLHGDATVEVDQEDIESLMQELAELYNVKQKFSRDEFIPKAEGRPSPGRLRELAHYLVAHLTVKGWIAKGRLRIRDTR